MLAQEESRRLGHNFLGSEQILLGLIGVGTGIAVEVLKSSGANSLKDVRAEVETLIGRGSGLVANETPFTPKAEQIIKQSLEESRQLGHNLVDTEHLLLGVIQQGDGVAMRVLENLGSNGELLKDAVLQAIRVVLHR
jgi:ATP-dependent Clp protease ATP-binding subunit ClpC